MISNNLKRKANSVVWFYYLLVLLNLATTTHCFLLIYPEMG